MWKVESLEEYWECTLNAVTWPEDDCGCGPDLILDHGGDLTLLINEEKKVKDSFLKCRTQSDLSQTTVSMRLSAPRPGL